MTQYILDAISAKNCASEVAICIVAILFLGVLTSLFTSYMATWTTKKNTQKLHSEMQQKLFKKAAILSFEYYDDPTFFNNFSIAISQADARAWGVLQSLSSFISAVLSTVALISILGSISPLLIVLAVLSVAISMIIQFFSMKISHQYTIETMLPQRNMDYVRRVYYQRSYAQEIRYNPQIAYVLENKFHSAVNLMFSLIKSYAPKLFLLQISCELVAIILKGFSLGYLIYGVYAGVMTVGEYAASSTGCTKLYNELSSFFDNIFQFYNHSWWSA